MIAPPTASRTDHCRVGQGVCVVAIAGFALLLGAGYYEYQKIRPLWVGTEATSFRYLDTHCPLDSPTERVFYTLTTPSVIDTLFCGMVFRAVSNPTYLLNWRSIPSKPTDVWFVTNPPSGDAKKPGMALINALTGGITVEGHTEFHDWENDPTGETLIVDDGRTFAELTASDDRRTIGTHLPFEWLPEWVTKTHLGEVPRKVVYLVREPKEAFVASAEFAAEQSGYSFDLVLSALVEENVAAALGTHGPFGALGELSIQNRGYKAMANGYAAAIGAEQHGGPKVLLLSQPRLANLDTVADEVAKLAAFLEVDSYDSPAVVEMVYGMVVPQLGNVSYMNPIDARLVDEVFAANDVDPRVTELYA